MLEAGVASNSLIAESRIKLSCMLRINACLADNRLGLFYKEVFNCLSQFFRLFAMNPMTTLWEFDEAGSRKFFCRHSLPVIRLDCSPLINRNFFVVRAVRQ